MSTTPCYYEFLLTNVVAGTDCGKSFSGYVGYSANHVTPLSRFTITSGNETGQAKPTGCAGQLQNWTRPIQLRLDGEIVFTWGSGVYSGWTWTLTKAQCTIDWTPNDPGLPPPTPTKYACINGVCALASQGIYDTVEQCQQTGCQAPGSPEKPLSELCPEGESCGQNSTCVTNQDLNNWIQAMEDMRTVLEG